MGPKKAGSKSSMKAKQVESKKAPEKTKDEDPKVDEVRSEIRDMLVTHEKGRMMKEGFEKMRQDELLDLDRRNCDLRMKIPAEVLTMNFNEYLKVYKEVPTLENIGQLFGTTSEQQPVRESILMPPPPPPPSRNRPRGKDTVSRNARTPADFATPANVKPISAIKIVNTPGARALRPGEQIVSVRGSILGVVAEAEEDDFPVPTAESTRIGQN